MDRRTLLAITLSFGIFLAWQKLYIEPRLPKQTVQQVATEAPPSATSPKQESSVAVQQPSAQASRPTRTLLLKSGTGEAVLADGHSFFTGWKLNAYKTKLSADAAAVDLNSITNVAGALELAFDDPAYAYLNSVQGSFSEQPGGARWTYEDANIRLTREFSASENQPWVDVTLSAEFKVKKPAFAFVSLSSHSPENDPEKQDRQLLYFSSGSVERIQVEDAKLAEVKTPVKYIGASSRYFLMAAIPQGNLEARGLIQPLTANTARASLVYPLPENAFTVPLRVYFGPKMLDILRKVDPALDNTVDLGWFTLFAYPLLKLLNWFYLFVKNYGIAIILLTLLLKIVTYPLTYKSMKSMKEMAKIQPQLQKVREKYKDDREALNREMMTLMKSHGYNPMAGCMPILIQMPIFIALYRVLYSSIELYQAPFAFWIRDLSAQDPLYITPILLTVTMYIQQKLTPTTTTDPAQAKMMQFMPIIFGAMMMNLPSGLTVYMLVNALASIVQQLILNKKFDTHHVPAVPARAR
ncbi:MAG: membrane protein insertase YidC [Oligoflexia bacterium]|nr:membrane protein insertase YidC [Oligoflexia bacterium]